MRLENMNKLSDEYSQCQQYTTYFEELKTKHKDTKDKNGFEEYAIKAYDGSSLTKTEECRKKLSLFWHKVVKFDKDCLLPNEFFDLKENPWLNRGMNYKNLVEPIDRYNYERNGFEKEFGKYEEGNNRPETFVYIEKKMKEQAQKYPKDHKW